MICFGLGKMKRIFESGNVCVTGLRGTGKDMLTSNVIIRRKKPYVSNIDYGGNFHQLDFDKIDCGKNNFNNFIRGNVSYYEYPYPKGADVYISDCGIYLPSQYCNELNKLYPYLATTQALSRQLGFNFHCNTQSLNRIYDKIREQSDLYIRCTECKYFFGLVFQHVYVYEKYQSCVDRVKPFGVRVPLLDKTNATNVKLQKEMFEQTYGKIDSYILIYRNKSKYDTYHFATLMKGGIKPNEKDT